MIKAFLFIIKYKILTDPINLSYHTKEFFQLPKKVQRKVLDKYFNNLDDNFQIDAYFDSKESRYYENNQEINFFYCYYFDKLMIEHNITNIKLIDRFNLSEEKIAYLIQYTLEIIKENNLKLDVNNLINYNELLPTRLSKDLSFMKYLVEENCYNIKYLTYNELYPAKQRDLIKEAIQIVSQKEFTLEFFLTRDKTLPNILATNIDFILYLIENDITNVKYLTEKLLANQTISSKEQITTTILTSLEKNSLGINYIEENLTLAEFLNRSEAFLTYILTIDLDNVRYVDWHNITNNTQTKIINYITTILNQRNSSFDIMSYPFRDLFFENYNFMKYLIKKDLRWIAVTKVTSKEENDKLIKQTLEEISKKNYKFKLEDFLEDGKYLNPNLIDNQKMVHYLFGNNVPLIQHINFFQLKSSRNVVENIVDELEKTEPEYEFDNNDYLIANKYPIPLSNSYRFMRYVIDKNFNNIAFIDISMIDKRELKRIINYAFRMVYYIRGNNKNLNFDLEGYFQNSDILEDPYFQECLKSL